ncbi:hypothetical protein CWR48_05920 [Oceanobacillus arenosus]|uniref:DUF5668 domain-containing protein n=1 Tax=Oceanobacillus arenosus TaxID=1229153 RepID=A0A3D8PY95_9BACI|nr:hypothetical protein [Oceanobacillus arenosus]RDW20238.1 hypothetical protein CWR48_05920 [Oceanobacillus arenosus]
MRTWRVGSISMGIALLMLGIVLLLSQVLHIEAVTILLTWWPIILIILGGEILLYLFLSKQEKAKVKYDFISIFFVGIIGMAGIGLTILTTTGILDKVNNWANIETKTLHLPEYAAAIDEEISRIVVNTGNHAVTFEDSQPDNVNIFGSYRTQILDKEATIKSQDDYLVIKEQGDTLYIDFKEVYSLPQPFNDPVHLSATILIPSDLQLEVTGNYNSINLKPRNITKAWIVNHVADVNMLIGQDANVLIEANDVYELNGDDWENRSSKQDDALHSGTMKIGEGKATLSITDAEGVSVSVP